MNCCNEWRYRSFVMESVFASSQVQPRGTQIALADLIRLQYHAASLGLTYSRRIRSIQAGGYLSPFKGRGMEFDEVRAYQPGDDVRLIDWRVTARSGQTHTKLFREERERPVVLFVDQGASMQFGTRHAFKSVVAGYTAALLAWAACANSDRIGAVVSAGDRHVEAKPSTGKRGVFALFRALLQVETGKPQEENYFANAFLRLCRIAKHGSLVYMISDFRHVGEIQTFLSRLSRHNDVVMIMISDPLEYHAPASGMYPVTDGHRQILWNTQANAKPFRQQFLRRYGQLQALCQKQGIHLLNLSTHREILKPLRNGLHQTRQKSLFMGELDAV